MRATLLLMVASLSVAGCSPGTIGGSIPRDRALPQGAPQARGRSDPARESSTKTVSAKEEPATLFASDRSQCYVTPEEFRTIRIGDSVSCLWSPGPGRPIVTK